MKLKTFLARLAPWLFGLFIASCQTIQGEMPEQQSPVGNTATPSYELTPGEIVASFPLGGEGPAQEPFGDLFIAAFSAGTEEYSDADGRRCERRIARLWAGTGLCPSVRYHIVKVEDTIEFADYRLRVLDIESSSIVFAISRLSSGASDCEKSLYNSLLNYVVGTAYPGDSYVTEAVKLHVASPWKANYTYNEQTIEGWITEISLSSERSSQEWQGTIHAGDIIEYSGVRIRVLYIDDSGLLLVYRDLTEPDAVP